MSPSVQHSIEQLRMSRNVVAEESRDERDAPMMRDLALDDQTMKTALWVVRRFGRGLYPESAAALANFDAHEIATLAALRMSSLSDDYQDDAQRMIDAIDNKLSSWGAK